MRQITIEVQISTGSAHSILTKDLDLRKKAPKFVPHLLTNDQKDTCVCLSRDNLHSCEDPLFLWGIITGDESWFSVLEPEQKHKSCRWLEKGMHPKKGFVLQTGMQNSHGRVLR